LVASTAPSITAVQSHRSRSSGFVWRPGLIVTADEALSEEGDMSARWPVFFLPDATGRPFNKNEPRPKG
jgi:hypothetical protein